MTLHWWAWFLGLTNASGPTYLAWSGVIGDLPMFGGALILYRRYNCHEPGCHRIGLHHIHGTPLVVCRKHHPDIED